MGVEVEWSTAPYRSDLFARKDAGRGGHWNEGYFLTFSQGIRESECTDGLGCSLGSLARLPTMFSLGTLLVTERLRQSRKSGTKGERPARRRWGRTTCGSAGVDRLRLDRSPWLTLVSAAEQASQQSGHLQPASRYFFLIRSELSF